MGFHAVGSGGCGGEGYEDKRELGKKAIKGIGGGVQSCATSAVP